MNMKAQVVAAITVAVCGLGALPITTVASLLRIQGIGFQAPGVPNGLTDRQVTVSGCGQSSTTTNGAAGPMFLCDYSNFQSGVGVTYEFALNYENTQTKKPVLSPNIFLVTVGKLENQSACLNNKQCIADRAAHPYLPANELPACFGNVEKTIICAPAYGAYAEVHVEKGSPMWGRSQWTSELTQNKSGFILQIGGPPAQ